MLLVVFSLETLVDATESSPVMVDTRSSFTSPE